MLRLTLRHTHTHTHTPKKSGGNKEAILNGHIHNMQLRPKPPVICPVDLGDIITVWWCPLEDHFSDRCHCLIDFAGHYTAVVLDVDCGSISVQFLYRENDGSYFQVGVCVCAGEGVIFFLFLLPKPQTKKTLMRPSIFAFAFDDRWFQDYYLDTV